MAVHVLDAICKLLEDMPCLRHFRRCTVLAKWPRGHVATLPSALKTPGWRKLKSIQSIKLYCKMLQNYILEIYIDLLHIVIWGFFVWSCLILFVLFYVSKSSVHVALKRLALFESALFAVRNGLQQITSMAHGRPRGTKSPAKRMRTDDRMIRNRRVCRCLQFDQISLIVFILVLIVQYWN